MPEPEAKPRTIPCATCGTPTDFFAPPLGPFCSQRCQMVDLGKWLGEEYVIPSELKPSDFEDEANPG